MRFFVEIKRRKVFHVAAAYAVVAWLLVQVAVAIEVPLDLPGWFDTATIVLVTLGFPLALILSWIFDWTPHGVVRDPGPDAEAAHLKLKAPSDGAPVQSKALTAAPTSLAELLAAGPLSISRVLSLGVRISEALAGVHADGLVHRALQPANIVISADGAVELANFGRASASGGAVGSAYASPEQVRGETPDFRSDQFSFGAMLYEMATGRRAFGRVAEADTLAAVIHSDPEPPSRLNAEIPLPLQWAIERCLAKRPSERYASTRELHADLVSIAETIRAASTGPSAASHNLPVQRTPLIGRQEDLDKIKQIALAGDARLVSLTGAGGIGKTRLLVELGRQLVKDFRGGVFFVALDGIQHADLVIPEIAKALRVPQVRESLDVATLKNYLRQHVVARTLLLLDNFEHVIDAAPVLAELLAALERLQIVVTSRAALRVYGEHEFRVAPLKVSDQSSSAEKLAESPAIKLFLDRATALPRNLDRSALATVAEICKRLDGLPLAIELAAARTRVLSLPALLERVRDPLQLLAGGPRDSPARQQTLRATLDWSYNLLDEGHKKLFRRLGVFVGGATLEAIEAVCNVDEDLHIGLLEGVESLVDNSLVQQSDVEQSEPRFAMLETMREYAVGRLAEAGEDARTHRAHAAYCLVLAGEASYMTTDPQREALYDRCEQELGNLRAALDWLNQAGNAEWGLRLCNSLGHFWLQRGYASEGFERIVKFLVMSKTAGDSELQLWSLCWAGDLAVNSNRREESKRYHLAGLELARKLHVLPAVLRGLNAMAVETQQAGDFDAARQYHEEAIRIAREAGGAPEILGSMLSNYADHAMLRGDYDLAQKLHEETARLFRDIGDDAAVAWSLNHQGDIARKRHDLDTARRLYEESVAKFRALGERSGTAACLYDLAALAVDAGDCATAQKLHSEALTLYRELGHRSDIPRVLEGMTRCALKAGALERALTLAGSAAAMRKTLSLTVQESAQVELDRGLDEARLRMTSSEAAASWMTGWGMPPEQAIAFALGKPEPASASRA
jgi:predicted ATPase